MSEIKTLYLAGPMRGYPEFNFPAFAAAQAQLEEKGFKVLSPAEFDFRMGFDPTGLTGNEPLTEAGFNLNVAISGDVGMIANDADAICLLPGWQVSRGVQVELAVADLLGIPVGELADYLAGELPGSAEHYMDPPSKEVRITAPTGGQKGSKPARFDLIPPLPLTELAELYGKGAEKYEDHNWTKGYNWSLAFAALMRHAWAFWAGENDDPETGLSNMAAVAFHAFSLIQWTVAHPEFDDRPGRKIA